MALRKAGEINQDKKVPNELTFRKFNATGKYLHETDIRWCIKNTKISSEKETIKWFKRFRTLCPKGEMNLNQVFARQGLSIELYRFLFYEEIYISIFTLTVST